MPPQGNGDDKSSGKRRPNAPSIAVDTSAVNSPQQSNIRRQSPSPVPSSQRSDRKLSPGDGRSNASGSGRSTPNSSRHDASPTHDAGKSNYLSVPQSRRKASSGGSSSNDRDDQPSPVSDGETAVESPGGDDDRSKKGKGKGGDGSDAGNDDDAGKIIEDNEALKPDPGTEGDFEVQDNKFAFTPGHMSKLLNPKSLSAFYRLGGLAGLEKGLRTNRDSGLSIDEAVLDGKVSFEEVANVDRQAASPKQSQPRPDSRDSGSSDSSSSGSSEDTSFVDRKRVFSDNRLPEKKVKSFWELAWIAYNDKVLILLTVAAAISLSLGIYQAVTAKGDEPRVQWVEGVAIILAIVIVVVVGAANDYQKEKQFIKLNRKKDDRRVTVTRSGKSTEISVHDVLVGDIVHLNPGDIIPVDGIFISGHNVKCDESSATGESDLIYKTSADEVYEAIEKRSSIKKLDCFILSGGKVQEGVGKFLVTATGVNSTHGKMIMSLQDEGQTTPLQSKLNILAEQIAKLGLTAGLVLFSTLFIKFLATMHKMDSASDKGQSFLKLFIVSVTIVVVSVPEGLPLAVTLALAFATTRMLKDNNLVRLLRACETMGNATTICSDKTGTLTQNEMTIVAATIGTTAKFGKESGNSSSQGQEGDSHEQGNNASNGSDDVPADKCVSGLSSEAKDLLFQSIVHNTTAFEGKDEHGNSNFVGSKTECALLKFARNYLGLSAGSLGEARANGNVVQMVPFDSKRKCMAVTVKLDNGKYRLLVKGASEIVTNHCSSVLKNPQEGLDTESMTDEKKELLSKMQRAYATRSLRALALAYRDFDSWPPENVPRDKEDSKAADFGAVFKELTFLTVVGIQDPLRPGVAEAVKQCQHAGVFVRMVTGDNILTGKAIAGDCGIFTPGGIAMEGPAFRKLNKAQLTQVIPRLQVLARSSPEDKKILVSNLKRLGETVAVTGDGTNDAPALKMADVGFSMGIAGTEVAKEASAIILMDDNFASIVKAMSWGRTVNDAVRRFLQFQITVNITATILTFVSAVASGDESSVLTAVQLLWVNLIMDTLAALALATDPPNKSVLDRQPDPKSAPLISTTMWKMIIGECIYQLAISITMNFAGMKLLGYDKSQGAQFRTVVFNTFVFMQIFNQCNCRRIDNRLNIFEGLFKNKWFMGIQFFIIGGQVLIVFFGGRAFSVERIDTTAWGISLLLGFLTIPVGALIRFIPDSILHKLASPFFMNKARPDLFVTDEEGGRHFQWNPALEEIRDQLSFLKKIRGGRLKHLQHKLQHPQEVFQDIRDSWHDRYRDDDSTLPNSPSNERNVRSRDASASPPPSEGQPPSRDEAQTYVRKHARSRDRSNSPFYPATAMAGVIAGSIAGWSPVERESLHGEHQSGGFNPNAYKGEEGHEKLAKEAGIELHPDTKPDDPIINSTEQITESSKTVPPSQNPKYAPHKLYAAKSPKMSPNGQSSGRTDEEEPLLGSQEREDQD